MLAIAVAIWMSVGSFVAPAIQFARADENPAYAEARPSYAWTEGNGTPRCTITIWHRYFDALSPWLQQNVITHEYGHCIGLMHISETGVMADPHFGLSIADVAEFYRVHPLPVRGFIPIAHD